MRETHRHTRRPKWPTNCRTQRGLTLVETVIATAILGSMVVSGLHLLAASVRTRQNHDLWIRGYVLAEEIMDEVLQCRYAEPLNAKQTLDDGAGNIVEVLSPVVVSVFGAETGEDDGTRLNFDDIDDYDGWVGLPPEHKDGTVRSDYAGWRRSVEVYNVDPVNLGSRSKVTDTGVKLISVGVKSPDGRKFDFEAIRFRNGLNEQVILAETTTVGWIGVCLQVGAGSVPLEAGVSNLNLSPVKAP